MEKRNDSIYKCISNSRYTPYLLAKKIGAKVNIPNHYDMFESNSENPLLFSEKIEGGFVMEFDKEYTVFEKDDRIFG